MRGLEGTDVMAYIGQDDANFNSAKGCKLGCLLEKAHFSLAERYLRLEEVELTVRSFFDLIYSISIFFLPIDF